MLYRLIRQVLVCQQCGRPLVIDDDDDLIEVYCPCCTRFRPADD